MEYQLLTLSTKAAARESLETRAYAVVVDSLAEGLRVANLYAPEHLCLLVQDPWAAVPEVKNAGGIFLGASSTEALGDYAAGPSHVMPTGGTARYASALNVRDFQKVIPVVNNRPGDAAGDWARGRRGWRGPRGSRRTPARLSRGSSLNRPTDGWPTDSWVTAIFRYRHRAAGARLPFGLEPGVVRSRRARPPSALPRRHPRRNGRGAVRRYPVAGLRAAT